MSSNEQCGKCTAPSPHGYLCKTCIVALRIEVGDVPALLGDLDITRARLDRVSAESGKGKRTRGEAFPMPFRPHVTEVVWVLRQTLITWCAHLARPDVIALDRTTTAYAEWLLTHTETLRVNPEAAQLADEVTDAVHQARRAIDRPSDRRLFLGRCGAEQCPEELYGVPWEKTARCPRCRSEWDVKERQEWMRRQAQMYLGSATEIAGFIRTTGVDISPAAIRNYAARGRITPRATREGRPLYRISDVLQALEDRYRRRTTRVAG